MRIFAYNLMFRDENGFFHQSRASRREREFLLSVSFFETRMRISVFTLVLRDEKENNVEKNVFLSIIEKNSESGESESGFYRAGLKSDSVF